MTHLRRSTSDQQQLLPVEFELPCDRVLIHREGDRLVIEPVSRPTNIIELLAQWRQEPPLEPEDQFPSIDDAPARPEDKPVPELVPGPAPLQPY